jgi:class 3 adenylate cyclase
MREDEAKLLQLAAAALGMGVSPAAVVRFLRTLSQAVRRIADAMTDVFRGEVEARLVAAGVPPSQLMTLASRSRLPLQHLGTEVTRLLLSHTLESNVFDNVALKTEAALAAAGLMVSPQRRLPAIAFADLVGFTLLTHSVGDARAAEIAATFEAIALDVSVRGNARLIKSLGDGVLVHFQDAARAAEACRELLRAAADAGLPPARVGLAAGPVLFRDGDAYGATVNRAARLVALANAGEIVGDAAVAEVPTSTQDLVWTWARRATPKDLPEMDLFRLEWRRSTSPQ